MVALNSSFIQNSYAWLPLYGSHKYKPHINNINHIKYKFHIFVLSYFTEGEL